MYIQQAPSPNFRIGRNGRSILAIVDHITAGAFPGALNWLQNPQAQASAHYLVTRSGEIYQLVQDVDTAWHAGVVNNPDWTLYDGTNPNRYTIGIEHEGWDGTLLESQYAATLWLHRQLIGRWSIPVDGEHIIGHYRIDSINRPNDPGPNFPWERLFADLRTAEYPRVKIVVAGAGMEGVIINNYSYAPVAGFCIALGRQVSWDGQANTVLVEGYAGPAYSYTPQLKVAIGNNLIPGIIISDRSYAQVRSMATALGHGVSWDAENRVVVVS